MLAAFLAACAMAQQRRADARKGGEEWNGITSPYYLALTMDRHMVVSDGVTQKILKYDLDGRLVASWAPSAPSRAACGACTR